MYIHINLPINLEVTPKNSFMHYKFEKLCVEIFWWSFNWKPLSAAG